MASFPSSIITTATFTPKVNTVDVIDASHPNLIQDEVIAIETTLGTTPALSSAGSGSHVAAATNFGTVNARLNNVEIGVLGDVHTQYVKKSADGGNTILASTSSTKPLIVKGASSQSVTLQEWQNNGGTALANIDQSGNATAASFVKTGGTSSQVLMADGSVTPGFTVNTTAKTAAYTLTSSDYGSLIQMNGAFAFSLTTGLSGAPVGTQIHLLALSTGASVAGTGVTLNGTPGLKLRAAYSSATLICLGTNTWVLIGDLAV